MRARNTTALFTSACTVRLALEALHTDNGLVTLGIYCRTLALVCLFAQCCVRLSPLLSSRWHRRSVAEHYSITVSFLALSPFLILGRRSRKLTKKAFLFRPQCERTRTLTQLGKYLRAHTKRSREFPSFSSLLLFIMARRKKGCNGHANHACE